jgi:hypothetical protein
MVGGLMFKEVIVSMLHTSHWRRYPATTYFTSWVNSKLADIDFLTKLCTCPIHEIFSGFRLFLIPKGGGDPKNEEKKSVPSEEETRLKMISQLRVKSIEEFFLDPAAFQAFKSHLHHSKLSMEYMEYLLFWEDVC